MVLTGQVRQRAPDGILKAEVLPRDQFVEHVLDSALHRKLKQFVHCQPTATLLEVCSEAIQWEREGFPEGARKYNHFLPEDYGLQYGVQSGFCPAPFDTSYSNIT